MHRVEPKVHLIAETKIHEEALSEYLRDIGAEDWATDAPSDVEEIVEIMGRGCYKSFGTELNPNITRVREGNEPYLRNLLEVDHGSVLEHAFVSFMFTDVSRVFTHELVTHRVGMAKSQESLRYVRLTDMGMWIPSVFRGNAMAEQIFESAWEDSEHYYQMLLSEHVLGEDIDKMSFERKKELTSAARRVAPIGLATNIGWSCNMRTLRKVITQRTSTAAEEEIRLVFGNVKSLAKDRWPNLFGDFS